MAAPLPRYALLSFEHMGRKFTKGEAFDLHDEMVELRPDLFTAHPEDVDPPLKTKPAKADTPNKETP